MIEEIRFTRPGYEADLVKASGKSKGKQVHRRYRNADGEFVTPDEAECTIRFGDDEIGDATTREEIGAALIKANGDGSEERTIIAMITPAIHYARSGYSLANEEPGCTEPPLWVKTAVDLTEC